MADEKEKKSSWKSFFINEETDTKVVEPSKTDSKKESSFKFPVDKKDNSESSEFSFNKSTSQTNSQISPELLGKFVDIYEKKFNELNQPGYDFFEFFQSVIHGDIENPQTYKMAYGMGSAMEPAISVSKLVSQADLYISEINKTFNQYVSNGTSKKEEIINQKQSETQNLTSQLSSLKEQLEIIKAQITEKESNLSTIDNKYNPQITEVENKLLANDCAKNKIISTIEKVKDGIKNNLK